ncbi:MAG: TlpA disulfide reductase family protein [Phycisphaerae bacterium]
MSGRTPAVALLVAAGLAVFSAGCGDEEPAPDGPTGPVYSTLFRFDAFTSAPVVGGGEVALRDLHGQVVLLYLLGTWSEECRRVAPLMVSVYERYRSRRFELVGLAYERTEDEAQARETVRTFRDGFKIPFPLALGPEGVWQELREAAGVSQRLPTLVLIDRQGVVRSVFRGLPPGYEQVLADRVERLLAEPFVPLPGAAPAG